MAKEPKNHGTPWTAQQVNQLEKLAKQNTPTRVIGLTLYFFSVASRILE